MSVALSIKFSHHPTNISNFPDKQICAITVHIFVPFSTGHWPAYSNWMYLRSAVDSHFIWKMEAVRISKTSAMQPIYKCCLTSKPFRKTADMPILLFNFPLTIDHWTCVSAGPMGSYCALRKEPEMHITSASSTLLHFLPRRNQHCLWRIVITWNN